MSGLVVLSDAEDCTALDSVVCAIARKTCARFSLSEFHLPVEWSYWHPPGRWTYPTGLNNWEFPIRKARTRSSQDATGPDFQICGLRFRHISPPQGAQPSHLLSYWW